MPRSADEAIRKAMEEGKFDNLPGKGKPLKLDEDPFEDPEWRLANKMLKEGGYQGTISAEWEGQAFTEEPIGFQQVEAWHAMCARLLED